MILSCLPLSRHAVLAALCSSLPLVAQDDPGASFTFRSPVLNSGGVQSLEELRGKPVLIEFWATY